MEEKVKTLALIGAGSVLGSAATLAISNFLLPTKIPGPKYNGMATPNLLIDEVGSEQLTRNIQFSGPETQQKVTASYVMVIGLRGVRSPAASMLLRSGVGRLLLVDFDQVNVEEVIYIAEELWHGRSARDLSIKDVRRAMWRSVNELMLVRWDKTKPASVSNLILLRFKEADEQQSSSLEDIKEEEPEFFVRVTSMLKLAELELWVFRGTRIQPVIRVV